MVAAQHKLLLAWKARADAASLNAFFPGGQIPAVGERWVQADLARLIRRLCDDGPAAMYQGEIPRQIVRQVHDHGGILAEEDFTNYKAAVVEANTIKYRGYELFTPPPPAGGLTALQTLKALERFDVERDGAVGGEVPAHVGGGDEGLLAGSRALPRRSGRGEDPGRRNVVGSARGGDRRAP